MLRLLRLLFFASLTALGTFVALPLPYVILGHPHLPHAEELASWHALSLGVYTTSAQTLALGVAATLLGPVGAFFSQAVYLLAGLVGLPVFAEGGGWQYRHAESFPCLLAFPFAAWLAARLARLGGLRRRWQGLALAQGAILLVGVCSEVMAAGQAGLKEAWFAHAWPSIQSFPSLLLLMLPLAMVGAVGDRFRVAFAPTKESPRATPGPEAPEPEAPEAPRRPERPALPAPPRRLGLPEAPQGRRAIEGPPPRVSLPERPPES